MRAAIFQTPGEALALSTVAEPRCEGEDLIIQVKRCGICGSDLHMAEVHDRLGAMTPLPRGTIMGHEFCGEIVEVGPTSHPQWRVGDRITALPYIACGRCQACLSGMGHRCAQVRYCGLGNLPGAYAEYMRIGAAEALRLPIGVDWQRGALVEPLAVALRALHIARLVPGEKVLVLGAGPIGLAAALWCRHFGAQHVIVCDKVPARLALAEQLGATATINASTEHVIARYKQLAGTRPDVIVECIGVPGTQQLAMDYAPSGGRIVVVGVCMAPDTILPAKAISKELQVNYVFMYRRQDFELTLELLDRDRIDPSPMLTRTVGFTDFSQTFESLKTDKTACKVLLDPSAS
jgi:(R,R)-butanediol dehydrogenase / meso-butanediol dehydrogenase / diacetyl reductase